MQVNIKQNQSIIDIALEHCGSVLAVAKICTINSMSVSEQLYSGTLIEVPDVLNPIVKEKVIDLSTWESQPGSFNNSFNNSFG